MNGENEMEWNRYNIHTYTYVYGRYRYTQIHSYSYKEVQHEAKSAIKAKKKKNEKKNWNETRNEIKPTTTEVGERERRIEKSGEQTGAEMSEDARKSEWKFLCSMQFSNGNAGKCVQKTLNIFQLFNYTYSMCVSVCVSSVSRSGLLATAYKIKDRLKWI